jgi:hypothetical protein
MHERTAALLILKRQILSFFIELFERAERIYM